MRKLIKVRQTRASACPRPNARVELNLSPFGSFVLSGTERGPWKRNLHDFAHHEARGAFDSSSCLASVCQIALTFVAHHPLCSQSMISDSAAMLTHEYGTASNIKSRVNRLSVLSAISSAQARLKLYNRVPPNGLVLYVGTILTDEGKEKKVNFDFEPHRPINTYVRTRLSSSARP